MMRSLCVLLALLPFSLFAQPQFGLTPYPVGTATSLSTYMRNCFAVDNNGNALVGFQDAGLGICSNGNWTFYNGGNSFIPSNCVLSLCPWGNTTWVGTTGGAAMLHDTTWTIYNRNNSGIFCDTIYSMYHFNNEIWFGTSHGATRFESGNWTTYTRGTSGLISDSVYCFCLDGSGRLMMGTAKGLCALDVINNSWVTTYSDNQNQPFTSKITALLFDPTQGETWISAGTSQSVFRMLNNVIYPFNAFVDDRDFPSPQHVNSFISPAPGTVMFCFGIPSYGLMTMRAHDPTPHILRTGGYNTVLTYHAATGKYYIGKKTSGAEIYKFDPAQVHPLIDGDIPDYENFRSLDVNNVKAGIANRGDMHSSTNGARYIVSQNDTAGTINATDLWMGGLDSSNNVHVAANLYRLAYSTGNDYFPGPLDTITGVTDSATAEKFDYIWKIDNIKILEFQYHFANGDVQNGTYVPDHDIVTWPARGTGNYSRNLAPFVDVNGNGIYDPLSGGDYPQIRGDQMLYCIFNDKLAPHTGTYGQPLGVEVHFSAYAYECPTATNGDTVANYTTYYHYDIFNRSTTAYHNMQLGVFEDNDLGYYKDDYIGCSPQANLGFAYNGTAIDGGSTTPSPGAYGTQPPASSVLVLDGPDADPNDGIDNDNDGTIDEAGEHNRMTGFTYINGDFSVTGFPQTPEGYYGYLNSMWTDSTPVTQGGNGYGGVTPTRFMYDGFPFDTNAWNETSVGNVPDDRRYLISCGPFTFQPHTSIHFDYAIIYSRDMVNPWGTSAYINTMMNDVQRVENWYQTNTAPSCTEWNVGVQEPQTASHDFLLYPNPASSELTLSYLPQSTKANYTLLDLTGRIVSSGPLDAQGITAVAVDALPAGIYFVRVNDGNQFLTKKFVKH